jgi:hypothetical protein
VDVSEKTRLEREAAVRSGRERIAAAGSEFISAAFSLLGQLVPEAEDTEEARKMAALFKSRMAECMEKDENGGLKLTLSLSEPAALDPLADALARIVLMRNDASPGNGKKPLKVASRAQGAAF